MKKITINVFVMMFLLGTFVGVSQTLDQPASWPNSSWTLSGSYSGTGLLGDPTSTESSFIFDDDAAGNGSSDNIIATSPVIDLTAASVAGETWITVSGNFTYYPLGGDVLAIEVYDADAMTWSQLHVFSGNTTTVSNYQNCTVSEAYTSSQLDISGYTATQLSGFQYRVSYDDQGGWQYGWCVESPTITSAVPPSCIDPSMLSASNITDASAELSWTENGSALVWDVEVVANGTPASGTPTATGVGNPYTVMSLTETTSYDFYVRADCDGAGTSNWVGPFTFTTIETCPTPSTLDVTNITETTADLSWTENGTATMWNIEIVDLTAGDTATGLPTVSGVTSNPYTATGLVGDNNYEFYVQTDCGLDGVSSWAGPFSYATSYVAVPPACGGVFLDSGGNSGTYSASESSSWTITPDNSGDVVTITFTYVDLEANTFGGNGCYDFLTIYNGPDNTYPVLAQTLCGEESGDGGVPSDPAAELNIGDAFTSTDPSGALTIEFSSDGSVQETGWSADVSCTTLGIDDLENNASFTYFPNPVKNTLTLNAQNTIENVTMYNMLGQEVLRATPNAVNSELNMSSLQDGAYFVKVTIANITKTIKVIKQ